MDRDNMRDNGVRRLDVHCCCVTRSGVRCRRVSRHVIVQSFATRMVCTGYGIIGADVRPCWREAPKRSTMVGPH